MRREFFILANVNETQRYAKWNERTPEGKRRKQMAQVNLEIVSRPQGISLSRGRRRQRLRRAVIRRDLRRGRR